jgi:hypothetical protein
MIRETRVTQCWPSGHTRDLIHAYDIEVEVWPFTNDVRVHLSTETPKRLRFMVTLSPDLCDEIARVRQERQERQARRAAQ